LQGAEQREQAEANLTSQRKEECRLEAERGRERAQARWAGSVAELEAAANKRPFESCSALGSARALDVPACSSLTDFLRAVYLWSPGLEDIDWAAVETFFHTVRGHMCAQDYHIFVEEYCIGGSILIVGALGDYLPQ